MKKMFLIFFGPPGSGKGTQAKMIGEKLNLRTMSTGELLRSEVNGKTKLGKAAKKYLDEGSLVGDEIINKMVKKNLRGRGMIFDGYPRNKKQLMYLVKALKDISAENDVWAILVEVSDKEVRSRLGGRRVCACGETYHIKFNLPKKAGVCDKCGQRLYIRSDDRPKIITDRLNLYHKQSEPLLSYWEKDGRLIRINGEQNIKKVQGDIVKSLKVKAQNL